MSTLNDVQNAMVNVITPSLYPNGTSSPSIAGVDIFIYPGDPLKANLDADLRAGKIHVCVFAMDGMTRNTTRFNRAYSEQIINIATINLTVAGNAVTVAGTITTGQACMIIVNKTGYSYAVQQNDTANTIAAALAALIPGASALNNVITITNAYSIVARVSTQGTARRILHSQESVIRARVIAPTHALRELVGGEIQLAFGINDYWLTMPDSINAFIKPKGIKELNQNELAIAFARDYLYLVEYHTVQVSTFQTVEDITLTETVQNNSLT